MGTCGSANQKIVHVQNFRLPAARDSRSKSSENLSCNFKLVVSNLRGAHLLKNSTSVSLSMSNTNLKYTTDKSSDRMFPKWPLVSDFQWTDTPKSLDSTYLEICVRHTNKRKAEQKLAVIQIDVLSLAVAPESHDLPLYSYKDKRRTVGRLAFQVHFEQNPVVELQVQELCVELDGRHSDVMLGCVVKAKSDGAHTEDAKEVMTFATGEYCVERDKTLVRCRGSSVEKTLVLDNGTMGSSQLVLSFWKHQRNGEQEINNSPATSAFSGPHAEVIVPLNDTMEFEVHPRVRDKRAFSEPLRNVVGELKGSINGKLFIKSSVEPACDRTHFGVRTENGIEMGFPSVLSYDIPCSDLPPEVLVLEQHRQVLQPDLARLAPGESISGGSILATLHDLKRLLKQETAATNNTDSLKTFFYMGVPALQKSQETLLGIAKGILSRMGSIKDPRNLALCSKVLKELFMRGELTRRNISSCSGPYLSVLISGLFRALHILSTAAAKQCNDFAVLVLVLCYYNIPTVKREMLDLAKELGEEEEILGVECKKEISEKLFSRSEPAIDPAVLLLIRQGSWKERLRKEEDTFLHFFYVWMKYTDKLLGHIGAVPWENIEGYKELLSVVMKKMSEIGITKYSHMMKKAAWAMVSNERQLNSLVRVLFTKTDPYDIKMVDSTLEMVVLWIKTLVHKGRSSPFVSGFDFGFFGKAVGIMLALPDLYTSYKCVWMLYKIFQYLPNEERAKIIETYILCEENFYALFYHWSYYYRSQFHLLLLYHIQHWACQSSSRVLPEAESATLKCRSLGDSFVSSTSTVNLPGAGSSMACIRSLYKWRMQEVRQIYTEEDSQMKRTQNVGKIASRRLKEGEEQELEAVAKVPLKYRIYIKKATDEFSKKKNEYKRWRDEIEAGRTPKYPDSEDLALLENEKSVDP